MHSHPCCPVLPRTFLPSCPPIRNPYSASSRYSLGHAVREEFCCLATWESQSHLVTLGDLCRSKMMDALMPRTAMFCKAPFEYLKRSYQYTYINIIKTVRLSHIPLPPELVSWCGTIPGCISFSFNTSHCYTDSKQSHQAARRFIRFHVGSFGSLERNCPDMR